MPPSPRCRPTFGRVTDVVLLTRALRLHDHPALAEAVARSPSVVPLFVLDDAIAASAFAAPNRAAFLCGTLARLRLDLRAIGGDLVVRRGDPARAAAAVAAEVDAPVLHATEDVTGFAERRQRALADACAAQGTELRLHPGVAIVGPGAVRPVGGDHYRVFSPYSRAWADAPRRPIAPTPTRVELPPGLSAGDLPEAQELAEGPPSPELPEPGEAAALAQLDRWAEDGLDGYEAGRDALAAHGTSRLSPYLHFGCLSPLEVESRLATRRGAAPFVRQLCWRDFYHQVTAAFPGIASQDYRPRGDEWAEDPDGAQVWRDGRTGYPIVDAGMRQLLAEGWMHNRTRLLTASFLVKDLRIDWRVGAAHFLDWLVDGDIAQNSANWQWVAGTGNDTRPNRVFNPMRQAERFDPDGRYVRRYVPELAGVEGKAVHQPWTLGGDELDRLGYPPPIVDHHAAAAALRSRGGGRPAGGDQQALPGMG